MSGVKPNLRLPQPQQWEPLALIPVLAGLHSLAMTEGLGWWLWGLLPGALMLIGGAGHGLLQGDPRVNSITALGGVLGIPAALLWMLFGDFLSGLLAGLGAVATLLVAGRLGVVRAARPTAVPAPEVSLGLDAKVGIDEALLGYFVLGARLPSGHAAAQVCEQAERMAEGIAALGYADFPERLHTPVAAPDEVTQRTGRIFGSDYETYRFDSAFLADEQLPGAAVWNRLDANRRGAVRVVRHAEPGRPWLLCIHGYRMGVPWMDLSMFSPRWVTERLGANLVQPVLPLHGPRRVGARSGDHYLDGDPLDLFYAQSQALSDLRQTLAWIRQQDPDARIGVYGISLGGYNAALLANYASDLDFVVAGIPVMDFSDALWRLLTPSHRQYLEEQGLTPERYRQLLAPVSPLSREPLLPADRRFILAANCDRIVLPEHPLSLAAHWGVDINWYQGSHLSVRRERVTRETVIQAMVTAGWPVPSV